jgi:hypothetical protein
MFSLQGAEAAVVSVKPLRLLALQRLVVRFIVRIEYYSSVIG